ncbi:Fic family protein [Cellulomonas sp. PSBB021]|uniref:Fic family protein n=1 Tax=Cellulomonas sp. PSBB021 TaxID=2003551 RepID=UPI000B8D3C52|nr:Fic family protein [Cellulomonas sp. PSBB021]ASR55539.1 cell filamentation protein Fic [Cellulomonas sp. PSBB021]
MKVPAVPPPLNVLLEHGARTGRLPAVLDADPRPLTDEYAPWDKLRFRTPPDGLTHDEWWLAVRLARHQVQRELPTLRDVSGRPFVYALPDEVLRLVDVVNRNASGSISVSAQVTNPATRNRYVVSSLIEEAITSSQLEGAATSRRVAKEMIRSGRPPVDRSERMILNNYRAMQRVTELRGTELTPELVLEIHRIVTDGTLDDPEAAGRVQDDQDRRVSVWGDGDQLLHRPPPVEQLPARLDALCAFANDDSGTAYLPPVLRAVVLHFMMGYDHYFEDGNGRTARAIFYWSMLRQGFWLAEFLTISQILKAAPAQYARSFLLTEQDGGDLTYFALHQLEVLHRAIDNLHRYLATKAEEMQVARRDIRTMQGRFNHRQLALLEHALRSPGGTYTTTSHATSHAVTIETARQDLHALEDAGLMVRRREGKHFAWSAPGDLPDRLHPAD